MKWCRKRRKPLNKIRYNVIITTKGEERMKKINDIDEMIASHKQREIDMNDRTRKLMLELSDTIREHAGDRNSYELDVTLGIVESSVKEIRRLRNNLATLYAEGAALEWVKR